jgi:hypothetical protein
MLMPLNGEYACILRELGLAELKRASTPLASIYQGAALQGTREQSWAGVQHSAEQCATFSSSCHQPTSVCRDDCS